MDRSLSREAAKEAFSRLRRAGNKRELAEALAAELGRLSVFDLQEVSASLEREVNGLPSPYREKIRPYFTEQLFGGYFRLMRMHGDGSLAKMGGDVKDLKKFNDYCAMILDDSGRKDELQYGGFYYLVGCFTMFVMDEPGHPVGMPFPGGFTVERRGGGYYCPIRDREKDVLFSICNYCPARQSETL